MTRLKHGNQLSQHPKKHKKQPDSRDKLASQWMAEDSRVKTDRNRVDKYKSLKEEMFRLGS